MTAAPAAGTTRHLVVRGVVQGVGFRASLAAEAGRLGVTGWVRNREDGSVEAVVQGPAGAVAEIIAWARRGPPRARVAKVEVTAAEAGVFAAFERWPSA